MKIYYHLIKRICLPPAILFTIIFLYSASAKDDNGDWFVVPDSYYSKTPLQYKGKTLFNKEIGKGIYLHIQGRSWRQGELLYVRLSAKKKDQLMYPTIIYKKNKQTLKIPFFLNQIDKIPAKRKLYEALLPIAAYQKAGRLDFTLVGLPEPVKKYILTAEIAKGRFINNYYKVNLQVAPKFTQKKPTRLIQKLIAEEKRISAAFTKSKSGARYWSFPFVHPTNGTVITAPFYTRRFYNNKPGQPHSGTDFRGRVGHPVVAVTNGKVVYAAESFYSGNMIILDHGNYFFSVYKHLSKITVKNGASVGKGQPIGQVGKSGLVTGPHLHLSLNLHGMNVDPLAAVPH